MNKVIDVVDFIIVIDIGLIGCYGYCICYVDVVFRVNGIGISLNGDFYVCCFFWNGIVVKDGF